MSVVMDSAAPGPTGMCVLGQDVNPTEGPCAACGDIVARYHAQIYRYLLDMVGNVAQARRLTHATFLTAYQVRQHPPDPIRRAWLYRIATTTALGALRQRRCRPWARVTPDNEDYGATSDTDWPTQCGEGGAVRVALARLPAPQRACLLLRARDGLTIDEIAYVLHLSSRNVRMTLSRAREQVRVADATPSSR